MKASFCSVNKEEEKDESEVHDSNGGGGGGSADGGARSHPRRAAATALSQAAPMAVAAPLQPAHVPQPVAVPPAPVLFNGGGGGAGGDATQLNQAEAIMRKAYIKVHRAAIKVECAWQFFNPDPPLELLPDYSNFVPPQNVMYLDLIATKIGKNPGAPMQYGSPAAFRADFQLVHDNCFAYNQPGLSPYNLPAALDVATAMMAAVDAALAEQRTALVGALADAISLEHWLCCTRCQKRRRACSYAEFVALRSHPAFACAMMAIRDCGQACDGCGRAACTCQGN